VHAATGESRTSGVAAMLKYRFCPKMDAVMATHVMATVKMVSACARLPLPFCMRVLRRHEVCLG